MSQIDPAQASAAFAALMFYVFAAVTLFSAIGCVISTNIVRTAMCLLGTLGGVAGLYFLLFANLLAVIQLIVYAGGTLILIIFGVMLTSKSPWTKYNATRGEIITASIVGVLMFFGLSSAILMTQWPTASKELTENAHVRDIGHTLLTSYLVPFEIASVLLLVVMIGAAYLARPEQE